MITGQPEQAKIQYDTVEFIGTLAAINQQIYNRQLANFYSDHDLHLDKALEFALTELESRQDIYGYDAAAWAQYKNQNFEEAQAMMNQALVFGTQDASLYYHAGMIEFALGNKENARELLGEALAINPHFSVLNSTVAQRTLETLQVASTN